MQRDDDLEKLEEQRKEEVADIKSERFNKMYFPEDFLIHKPQHHDDEIEDGD